MKLLNGSELAGYIKQRHLQQVHRLRASKVFPKLAIVQVNDDPAINTYVRLKKQYGADIGVEVEVHRLEQKDVPALLEQLNNDENVHGIIIQLPLTDTSETDKIVNLVAPQKDVDSLGEKSQFEPATPMAILWLLNGYNIELKNKKVLLVGRGKLVGEPLEKILNQSSIDVEAVDRDVQNLVDKAKNADVIITATGSPGLLKADMIKQGAVIVDAGVASEEGKTVGDLDPVVYKRDDLTITPEKGGVGPLTVCALFENVIRAAQKTK